jgi:hypothetical protein
MIVREASKYQVCGQKILYLKSIVEFQHLKDDGIILEKFRRWSSKIQSDHTSEFRGSIYGAKIDNLVARDIEELLLKLHPKNKKYNCSIVNIDILDNILYTHCASHGKESVYRETKRGKGWAVNFCKRHSFNKSIMSVVGSTKSKKRRHNITQEVCIPDALLVDDRTSLAKKSTENEYQSSAKRRRSNQQDVAYMLLGLKFVK